MFSRFFIERPVFAGVVSIVILLAGGVTIWTLPVALYPQITPPTVKVSATYPGADPEVIAETVAQPIEEQVNGVEDMIYMSSSSAGDGSYDLTVSFDVGTDLDMAAVRVQNRVAIAESKLPDDVRQMGVTVRKQSTDFVMLVNLYDSSGQYGEIYLSNYALLHIRDRLSRVSGVGDVSIMGARDYGMRLWLDPDRMASLELTPADVADALREQNVQVAAGSIGREPVPPGQDFQLTVSVQGRLSDPEQFGEIVLKTGEDRSIVRVRDVGRVELGAQSYDAYSQLNGKPTATLAVYQLPGSNALEVSESCRQALQGLAADFPQGIEYKVTFDATWFVNASIREIVTTLLIAVTLVVLVVFVFLQDWRASLVPAVVIPVSLVGTFAIMAALGFTINQLTMFGLVLAIGIVVDDAIVVVENVKRKIDEESQPPRQAAIDAMREVTGPVVATTLVLLAVFVPTAFLGGITGQLYRQFALTIAGSTVISSICALTLSPALCALLLRKETGRRNVLFRGFNFVFDRVGSGYGRVVERLVRRGVIVLGLFVVLGVLTAAGYLRLPTGFIPEEDQGYFFVDVQLPDAASQQRTAAVTEQIQHILDDYPEIDNVVTVVGFSIISGTASGNVASVVIILDRWDERTGPQQGLRALLGKMQAQFQQLPAAQIMAFAPPSIPGLGSVGGVQMQLQDRAFRGPAALQEAAGQLVALAARNPAVRTPYTTFRANVPELYVQVDRTKAKSLQVPLTSVFDTLQSYLGSKYVNDFNLFGQVYQVRLQAEGSRRDEPEDIARLHVRNLQGEMLPLDTIVDVERTFGPQSITRFNMYPAALVTADTPPGLSSGETMDAMASLVETRLPSGMGHEWSGVSYQQVQAGQSAPLIFTLAVVFVFLFLAAQYESFLLPVAVILSVPLAMLGAVLAVMSRGMDNNVYTQIGVVLLIGLASKNAILIVEFARFLRAQGRDRWQAAAEASKLRFRAILMTAFSDLLGWLPLAVATGAGAASRRALGTAVLGGMAAAVLLGLFFVPNFFVAVQAIIDRFARKRETQ